MYTSHKPCFTVTQEFVIHMKHKNVRHIPRYRHVKAENRRYVKMRFTQ